MSSPFTLAASSSGALRIPLQGFDNDDGSSWYNTYDNFFYDASGFKMDCACLSDIVQDAKCSRVLDNKRMHLYVKNSAQFMAVRCRWRP